MAIHGIHVCVKDTTLSQIKIENRLTHVEILLPWLLKKYLVLPVSWLTKLKVGLSIKGTTAGVQMLLSQRF